MHRFFLDEKGTGSIKGTTGTGSICAPLAGHSGACPQRALKDDGAMPHTTRGAQCGQGCRGSRHYDTEDNLPDTLILHGLKLLRLLLMFNRPRQGHHRHRHGLA